MNTQNHSHSANFLLNRADDPVSRIDRLNAEILESEMDQDDGIAFYRGIIPAFLLSIVLWAIIAGIAWELWIFARVGMNFIS